MNTNLNSQQQEALNLIIQGKNVFITGSAGTGKTHIIKEFEKIYNKPGLVKCATTGCASLLIGGMTIHRFAGIRTGTESADYYISIIKKNRPCQMRWKCCKTLIIDEISMMNPDLFDKLNDIAIKIRNNNKPFGGIQIILLGDYAQLPPVKATAFCYESKCWNDVIDNTIHLTINMRQIGDENALFIEVLNNMRLGIVDELTHTVLDTCIQKELINEYNITPTFLYPTRHEVNTYNLNELQKLIDNGNQIHNFNAYYSYVNVTSLKEKEILNDQINNQYNIDDSLTLVVGAQVMLIINQLDDSLCNGSKGVILRFYVDGDIILPVVKFLNGVERVISFHAFEYNEDQKIIKKHQIPLIISYAMTIHKAQGITVDYLCIDLKNIFEYGQVYVALSRVKNINGLSILNLNYNKIKANPRVIEYYNNLL